MKLTLPAATQAAQPLARPAPFALVLAAALAGAACSAPSSLREYVPQIVTPYRIDIQQGNFVTQDMVDKLQVGQTRDQVRFILGTPMLTDVFHAGRWDYVFRSAKGWNEPEKRRLTLFFDQAEKLQKWEAIAVPPPVDLTGGAGTAGANVSAATLPPQESPGLLGRLFGWTSPARPAAPASAGAAASAAAAPLAAVTAPPAARIPSAGTVAGVGNLVLASDARPAAAAAVAAAPAAKPAAQPAPASAEQKPGLIGRMFGWLSPATATAVAPAPTSAPAVAAATPAASPAPVPAPPPAAPQAAPPAPTAAPVNAPSPPPPAAAAAPVVVDAASAAAITGSIEQWRAAWSGRDLASYLASYAPDFKPAGMTRARWEAQRKERLSKPVFIFVNVFEPHITIGSDQTATVVFTQLYETETVKQSGRKTLVFANIKGKWLIRDESFKVQ